MLIHHTQVTALKHYFIPQKELAPSYYHLLCNNNPCPLLLDEMKENFVKVISNTNVLATEASILINIVKR